MRWTVHGIPRVPWEAEGVFDGISQYKLDSEGRIYEHAVDNVILRDPPMQGLGPLLAGLNLVPGAPQQAVPGEGRGAGANGGAAPAQLSVHQRADWGHVRDMRMQPQLWRQISVYFSTADRLLCCVLCTLALVGSGGSV